MAATVRTPARAPAAEALVYQPGATVGRGYRLVEPIGRSSGGEIWKATKPSGRAVALKLLARQSESSPEIMARFEREVRLGAALKSPYVVQVLDYGFDDATGRPFVVTELFNGQTLEQFLKRRGRASAGDTFAIASDVVRALKRAHAEGVVHRNLKPSNIFVVKGDAEACAKVTDFGIAQWRQPTSLSLALTQPGTVLGTPRYMSPEQMRGSSALDGRTDVWSLAVIVAECLTGRQVFEGRHFAEVAAAILDVSRRPVPSRLGPVPEGFDAWFARATHPKLAHRFQTPGELLEALVPACRNASPRERENQRSAAPPRREPTQVLPRRGQARSSGPSRLVSALLAVVALGSAAALWYSREGARTVRLPWVTAPATTAPAPTTPPATPPSASPSSGGSSATSPTTSQTKSPEGGEPSPSTAAPSTDAPAEPPPSTEVFTLTPERRR